MTIHEAIATGKQYKRSVGPMREGPLEPCVCTIDDCEHLPGDTCVRLATKSTRGDKKYNMLQGVSYESFHATDWEVEPSEEDFADLAESLLNGIGIMIGVKEKV